MGPLFSGNSGGLPGSDRRWVKYYNFPRILDGDLFYWMSEPRLPIFSISLEVIPKDRVKKQGLLSCIYMFLFCGALKHHLFLWCLRGHITNPENCWWIKFVLKEYSLFGSRQVKHWHWRNSPPKIEATPFWQIYIIWFDVTLLMMHVMSRNYCWVKKSCTTWDVRKRTCKEWEQLPTSTGLQDCFPSTVFDIDIYSRILGIQDQTKNGWSLG